MATTAPLPSEVSGARLASRLEECGDETLAHLVAEADEAAFAVLYERHYQALYRYCRSIVRDDLDAQDALQTAWTSALIALRRGRRDGPVRPWLYRIVHNEAISALRRRRRSEAPTPAPASDAASAEDHAIDRERFELLVADLRQLPERPRGALLMRELNGLSHEEIAAALETSVAAAKQCVYEARRHLADFAAGRQTPCDEICRSISDGDRRVLRGRRVMAHLRHCPDCAAFASAIDRRCGTLHALTPWLAAPAAIAALDEVLHAGWGAGSSAAAGASGAAGASSAGGATAAGSAGPAVVAGGVVAKAISLPLIGKALIAAAAVTAGALSVNVAGAPHHRHLHLAPVAPAPAPSPPDAPVSVASAAHSRPAATRMLRPAPRSHPHAAVVAPRGPVGSAAPRRSTRAAARALAPGQAKRAAGAVPPGQAKKTSGSAHPGRAQKTAGAVAPGQAKKSSGAAVSTRPVKASKAAPPGQARKAGGSAAPAQDKQATTKDKQATTTHGARAAATVRGASSPVPVPDSTVKAHRATPASLTRSSS